MVNYHNESLSTCHIQIIINIFHQYMYIYMIFQVAKIYCLQRYWCKKMYRLWYSQYAVLWVSTNTLKLFREFCCSFISVYAILMILSFFTWSTLEKMYICASDYYFWNCLNSFWWLRYLLIEIYCWKSGVNYATLIYEICLFQHGSDRKRSKEKGVKGAFQIPVSMGKEWLMCYWMHMSIALYM